MEEVPCVVSGPLYFKQEHVDIMADRPGEDCQSPDVVPHVPVSPIRVRSCMPGARLRREHQGPEETWIAQSRPTLVSLAAAWSPSVRS